MITSLPSLLNTIECVFKFRFGENAQKPLWHHPVSGLKLVLFKHFEKICYVHQGLGIHTCSFFSEISILNNNALNKTGMS